jgi:ribose-phosphate pyrophosphokinase
MPGEREPSGTIRVVGSTSFGNMCESTITISSYPDGMPIVGFPAMHISKMLLRPRGMRDFMAGLFLVDALEDRNEPLVDLILPFVPGARQDRLNDSGDYLFTAKSVAREINARIFRSVTILDPHSEVTPALLYNGRVVHAADCLSTKLLGTRTYDAVVSPDAGAEKRASGVAKMLGVPMLHAWKTREVGGGRITDFGLESVASWGHARVLVVDDICDGGGTFIGLGEILEREGLRADLYVTHGIFSQGVERLFHFYDKIYCTDSIEGTPCEVEVLPICKNLLGGVQ